MATETTSTTPEYEYPGKLEHWKALQQRADQTEGEAAVAAGILAELAGLSYLLDGIRFSARAKGGGQ